MNLADDLQVTAATAYGEARGEGIAGIQAVIAVISNRVADARRTGRKQFGGASFFVTDDHGNRVSIPAQTFAAACLAPWQFSSWNASDPNRNRLFELDFNNPDPVLRQCMDIAQQAINEELDDPTNGCCFYKVSSLAWPSDWGQEVDPVVTIGHQSFYHLP